MNLNDNFNDKQYKYNSYNRFIINNNYLSINSLFNVNVIHGFIEKTVS